MKKKTKKTTTTKTKKLKGKKFELVQSYNNGLLTSEWKVFDKKKKNLSNKKIASLAKKFIIDKAIKNSEDWNNTLKEINKKKEEFIAKNSCMWESQRDSFKDNVIVKETKKENIDFNKEKAESTMKKINSIMDDKETDHNKLIYMFSILESYFSPVSQEDEVIGNLIKSAGIKAIRTEV